MNYRVDYLRSQHWKLFRAAVIAKRPRCEKCGINREVCKFFYFCDLDVHHLSYKNLGMESPDEVQVLCRGCHEIEETLKKWPDEICFKGAPSRAATCPNCGQGVYCCVPIESHRTDFPNAPVYKLGAPRISECACEIDDVEAFILSLST